MAGGFNAATIKLMADKGLTAHDIAELAAANEKRPDPTNAERQARFKAKRNGVTVTRYPPNDNISNPPPPSETKVSSGGSATRLPDDFVMPDEWKQWARETRGWSAADIETEAANFTDYWQARGSGAAKRDWRKTWQTWVRNSKRLDGSHRNDAPAKPFDQTDYEARLARIDRRESTGPPRAIGDVLKQAGVG